MRAPDRQFVQKKKTKTADSTHEKKKKKKEKNLVVRSHGYAHAGRGITLIAALKLTLVNKQTNKRATPHPGA